MYVVGTAGHVDHGKSSLVRALTGIDPDRLQEEKEREMTIDLGFAWMALPDGNEIGIVDVPGHRDFIENMLAGIGGIDLALFVIAADEGVMPQTVEHLAILDLLEVKGGVIALTKTDLVDDPDWLELVMLDISESLSETVLSDSPIVPVSSKNGEGIEAIREAIVSQLQNIEPRKDNSRPRLPIDRVFSLPGFGTVVTGTLSGGQLNIGDLVEIEPGGRQARIRGLQTHRTKRDQAFPGTRVAVNLSGVHKADVERGEVIAVPGVLTSTILCDVSYRHLETSGAPLKHNTPVKLFIGSAEVMARTRVLRTKAIGPGEEGWLQLELEQSAAMVRGDRFILRRPSPPLTLGGGRILDASPGRKHRRFGPEIVQRLEMLEKGTPEELLLEAIFRHQPAKFSQLASTVDLNPSDLDEAYQDLITSGRAELLDDYVLTGGGLKIWSDKLNAALSQYHARFPLRKGMPREELRSQLRVPSDFFIKLTSWAEYQGRIGQSGTIIYEADHQIRFSSSQEQDVAQLKTRLTQAGVNSPSVKECKSDVGDDVYNALLDLGELVQIRSDVIYSADVYNALVSQILEYLRSNETIDVGKLRDLLSTSRKYAIALLEHLDDIRVTRRVGDERELIAKSE